MYLEQELNDAQFELDNFSEIAESFFPPQSSLGTTRRRRSTAKDQPHNRSRRLNSAVATLAADTGFILRESMQTLRAMHSPFLISAIPQKIQNSAK